MYYYLPKNEVAMRLAGIVKECFPETEHVYEMLCDVSMTCPEWLSYTVDEVLRLEKRNAISRSISSILYMWQEKNILNGHSVFANYFYDNSEYKQIAIYGLGRVVKLFIGEIKNLPVIVKYGIDKEKKEYENIKVMDIEDNLEQVDLFIVTVSWGDMELKEYLIKKGYMNVFTLREMLLKI